jgi:hypothetical protein
VLEEKKINVRSVATQTATFALKTKPLRFAASVEVTSKGLLAIAALVSSILLATAAVVRSATRGR